MKSQREIEQIKELQSIRNLMHEVRERIRNTEDGHLEEYLRDVLREIEQRVPDSESSSHEPSPQRLSVRDRARRVSDSVATLSSLVHWKVLGAVLAGLAWIAAGIVDLANVGGQGYDILGFAPLDGVLYCVGSVGMLGGLAGLHTLQAPRYKRLGTVGFLASFLGILFLLIGLALSFLVRNVGAEERALLDQLLVLGFVGSLIGFVLLGTATLRLGELPGWCGWLLITCLPLAITLGDYGGAISLGLTWLALAYVLLVHRDLSTMLKSTG